MSKELLDEWQTRLGLHDWRIKLNDNCKPDDMPVEESDGATEWTECNKTARIDILDPQYYGERIIPFDYERIFPDLQARYMHQMIDDFVDAKRSKDEPQTEMVTDCHRLDEPQTDVVALDKATLMDYLINSVDENDEPVWTERHIDEILKDFDVVPKTEPQTDCAWGKGEE